ncbi:MAG: hypothetical protein ACOYL6_18870 [Bacteriovoracaceae bacterium]
MKTSYPTLNSAKSGSVIVNYLKINLLLLVLFIVSACGKSGSQLVTDVKVATRLVNQEVWVDVNAKFDLGNTALPSITLPIANPKDPTHVYGSVSMAPTFDGKNQIGISVNFTEALKIQGGAAALPNGTGLPVGGLANVNVIQLMIPNTQARVYVALDHGVAMAGFAIAIKELDSIGSSLGGINLFPSFQFDKIKGIAGVFTGGQSGQTGLALFVDLSSVLNQTMLNNTPTNLMVSEISGQMSLQAVTPSASKKGNLEKALMKFGTKSKKVKMNIK